MGKGFDNLARSMAEPTSRRGALKVLGAAGAAAAAATLLRPFSVAVMEACLKASDQINVETSASNPDFKKIYDSQMEFRNDENLWWQVAEYSYESFMIRTRPKG